METDKIHIILRNGHYHLNIKSEQNESLKSDGTADFYQILSSLTTYSLEGRQHHQAREYGCPIYYSSSNGIPEPRFVNWDLELKCELPESQRKLLDNIVYMHNHLVTQKNKRIPKYQYY